MRKIGSRIADRYQVISCLGHGAMGSVYLTSGPDRELAAVKVMHPDHLGHERYLARFRTEGEAMAAVDHPNVARLIEADEDEDGPFIAMQYVAGPNLRSWLRCGNPLETDLGLAVDLCDAVEAIHEAGYVHRDIKPANVIVDAGPVAILADFGLAKVAAVPSPGRYITGTPDYIAPEQYAETPQDPDALRICDVYAVGMTLYEVVAGRLPFPSGDVQEVLRKRAEQDPPLPSRFRADIPRELNQIILKAVARRPADRFQSCADLGDALSDLLDTMSA